jgi:hypothetical protein
MAHAQHAGLDGHGCYQYNMHAKSFYGMVTFLFGAVVLHLATCALHENQYIRSKDKFQCMELAPPTPP